MERIPFENIIYFGDTARTALRRQIRPKRSSQYASDITKFLLGFDVKLLIIA